MPILILLCTVLLQIAVLLLLLTLLARRSPVPEQPARRVGPTASSELDAEKVGERFGAECQSRVSKGIRRQGPSSFCQEFLRFNTTPCRHMPLLVHF